MSTTRTYFITAMILVFGGMAYVIGYHIFDTSLTTLELAYPSYYGGTGQSLLEQFMYWLILFAVVISALLYVIRQGQKNPEGFF